MKNVGCRLGSGIHVELLLGEGSTVKIPELLIRLFPLASLRDTMNSEPATNGNGLRAIPLEKLVFCRGTAIVEELKGRMVKEAGARETGEVSSEKVSSNDGAHC